MTIESMTQDWRPKFSQSLLVTIRKIVTVKV